MKKLNEYSYNDLKDIIEDVRMSYQWYITRDGEIFSANAENFLESISIYAQFCIPETAESFLKDIRYIVYHPKIPQLVIKDKEKEEIVKQIVKNNTDFIIENLFDYINACQIVETYAETNSWKEVETKLHEQGHSGYTFSGLSNVLIKYFPMGVEFIDKFAATRTSRDKEFNKYYLDLKQKVSSKKETNHVELCQHEQ